MRCDMYTSLGAKGLMLLFKTRCECGQQTAYTMEVFVLPLSNHCHCLNADTPVQVLSPNVY